MNLSFSLPAPLLLSVSLSRSQLVAALVIGVEWLPDCVAPTFQLMGSGERVFISPKQTHPTASWGLLWRGMWVCVYRGDSSLRFYLQITQMLSFTKSRSCYRTEFFKFDHSLTIYNMYSDAWIQLICLFQRIQTYYCFQWCIKSTVWVKLAALSSKVMLNLWPPLGDSKQHQFASVTRVKKPWKNRVNVIYSC